MNPNPRTDQLVATQFKPGNPGGRPKPRPLSSAYEEELESVVPAEVARAMKIPARSTWAQAIAKARCREAITRGGTQAAAEIANRVEGKPMQRVELLGAESGISINVNFELPLPQQRTDPASIALKKELHELPAETEKTIEVECSSEPPQNSE
jgi:hypothetical protein